MGLPCPRCRNSMKFLLVQLSRFSRPVWTEVLSISMPATLNLLSSTDLQNVHFVSLPTFLSTLWMKILNNMGPSINPWDIQFLPVATYMSSHWLLPFTSSSPRDLKPFARTRKAQESKMTWNVNMRRYVSKSYLRWQRKKTRGNLTRLLQLLQASHNVIWKLQKQINPKSSYVILNDLATATLSKYTVKLWKCMLSKASQYASQYVHYQNIASFFIRNKKILIKGLLKERCCWGIFPIGTSFLSTNCLQQLSKHWT